MARFDGRKAWVTGTETPLGQAIAYALAAEGCSLLLSGITEPPAGITAQCYPHNPIDDKEASEALHGFGPLDYYVHAAGHVETVSIQNCPVEVWEKEMDINLMTAWCGARAAVRAIGKNRGGAMVFLSSIHDEKPTGSSFLYSVAQGAISMIMREASLDYGRLGIRVNLVEAGPVLGDETKYPLLFSDLYDAMDAKIPRGHPADPAEIAKPVLFLLSEEASYINGATLRVDGGFLGYYGDGDSERRWANGNS